MFPGIGCENKIRIPLFSISQGQYDNFNFKIASSPEAAASAYEAYSSVFADFHPKRRRAKAEDEAVEWRINRREAAAQSGRGDYVEGSGGDYNDLSFVDYEKVKEQKYLWLGKSLQVSNLFCSIPKG